ncbi:MAG: hypothetical protein KDA87_27460, partial [Planctomycetales bacterium]|nr:hypothetical protein [Planctomycetales bacterium]
ILHHCAADSVFISARRAQAAVHCHGIISQDAGPPAGSPWQTLRTHHQPRANASYPMPRIPTQPSGPVRQRTIAIICHRAPR